MKRNKRRIIMVIALVLLNIAIGILLLTNNKEEEKVVEVKTTHVVGPYTINSGQTDYLVALEKQLSESLTAADDEKISNSVAQYFVSDYFTLANKTSAIDVGGLELVLPANKSIFEKNSIDSFYIDYPYYVKSYTKEKLPEVIKTTVSSSKEYSTKKVVNDKNKSLGVKAAKQITLKIEYKEVEGVKYTMLDTTSVVVVKDEQGVWYIYQILGA